MILNSSMNKRCAYNTNPFHLIVIYQIIEKHICFFLLSKIRLPVQQFNLNNVLFLVSKTGKAFIAYKFSNITYMFYNIAYITVDCSQF